jgi:hypothetical protein
MSVGIAMVAGRLLHRRDEPDPVAVVAARGHELLSIRDQGSTTLLGQGDRRAWLLSLEPLGDPGVAGVLELGQV